MKFFVCLLALVCASMLVLAEESDVIVLLDHTFDKELAASSSPWLIEFYAPWCGHCKKLTPTWEELATSNKDKFKVAKLDCTTEKVQATRFGIRGFPTVKLIFNGKVYDYRGARTVADFTAFVESGYTSAEAKDLPPPEKVEPPKVDEPTSIPAGDNFAKPSDIIILTDTNFQKTISKGIWLVKYYAPWCGHCKRMAPLWEELATQAKQAGKYNVAKLDCITEKETASKEGIPGYPTVKLYKDGKHIKEYQGQRTLSAFTEFMQKELGV